MVPRAIGRRESSSARVGLRRGRLRLSCEGGKGEEASVGVDRGMRSMKGRSGRLLGEDLGEA